MNHLITFVSVVNVIFLFMHEFDAVYEGEWKMFGFLKSFGERIQYLIFLYSHVLICGFVFYYLWCVCNGNNYPLWITVNFFGVFHFLIHIIAIRWKSNVFKSFSSFLFISGMAITGVINLILFKYY